MVDDDYISVESDGASPPPKESKKSKIRNLVETDETDETVELLTIESPEVIVRNSNKKPRVQKKHTIYDDDDDDDDQEE